MYFKDDPDVFIDYDFGEILPNELRKAKALFETIGEVIGRSTRATISSKSNFYALGGNSLNSIYTVAKLRERGYSLEITNFIAAKNLKEIIAYMTEIGANNEEYVKPTETKNNFIAAPLSMDHKKDTIQ